jgi:broad specificity phosphatase PhoE
MCPTLYLIRHGERSPIPSKELGNEIELTEKGRRESREFGKHLENRIAIIQTSPLLRCFQTALEIARGADFPTGSISTSTLLGNPGAFIEDAELAWALWQEWGQTRIHEYLLSGSKPYPGFKDPSKATAALNQYLKSQLKFLKQDQIAVLVTHDTVLAPFVSRRHRTLTQSDWPDYLGFLRMELGPNGTIDSAYSVTGRDEELGL